MSYFKKIQSLDDLKEQFKKLAREHHPDAGGDAEIMKQINQEYDTLFPIWKHRYNMSAEQPTEETSYSTRSRFYTENGWEGDNYDSKLTLKEIAKIVRTYVKEMYPTYKFSVRTKYASMVQELHVDLIESPIEIYKTFDELTDGDKVSLIKKAERNNYFRLTSWNDAELREELERIWEEHGNFYKCLNDVTSAVISDVDNFVNSYNYDDSDVMIDYFDNNFYYFGCAQNNGMNIKVVPKTARIKNKEGTLAQDQRTKTPKKDFTERENGENTQYNIEKSKHTKTGEDIWLVRINDKLERDDFLQEKEKMKELGGYYSKYTHSFIFKEDPTHKLQVNNEQIHKSDAITTEESQVKLNKSVDSKMTEEATKFPSTLEAWRKLGFGQTKLIHDLEVELSLPDKECITRYWGDMDEYEFKGHVSEQEAFERYSKLKQLNYLSQKIEGVQLGNFEWDEDNYLHFTAEVDGYELEGLFRTSDLQNGKDMKLVSIDYGYSHSQIKEQWGDIEEFLKEYSADKYNEITHGKTTIAEENYQALLKLAPEIVNGKRNQMEFTAGEEFHSLSIENIGDNRVSMMHWYIVNGDVVRDPDIEFILNKENQTLIPMTYQQWDNYQSVERQDGTIDKMLQDDLNSFMKQWFTNLNAQGYIPVEKVIENIRAYENSIGKSENECVTELDEDHHVHLKEGDEHAKDYVKYSRKCEEYLRFGYEIDEVISGNYHVLNQLKVCDTPDIFIKAGFELKPLLYTQKHVRDAILPKDDYNPHQHGLTIEQLKKLPYLLENPVMIANSPARKDAVVVVLNEVDADKLPLIAAIKPDGKGNYELKELEANFILSVYGRDNFAKYFEERITPEEVVYINKEKSQELEALAELQLFRCHSTLDSNTIIQKPECIVNMENEKYVRIIEMPEISFDKWIETSRYDKQRFPSEAERIEAMMGRFESQTQYSKGVLNGKQDKVEYYNKAYEAYQTEVKEGKIPLMEKKIPLDLSKEQDCAFCRMEIKRLEKQGNYKEAENWRNYYNKNNLAVEKGKEGIYSPKLYNDVSIKLDNTQEELQQEGLGMLEDMDVEIEPGV